MPLSWNEIRDRSIAFVRDWADESSEDAELKAHRRLERAVDSAYGHKGKSTDADRAAFLFELYQKYTSLFTAEPKKPRARKKSSG